MKQLAEKSLLDNPMFTRIFSFCVAVLCWVIVAMTNVSEYKETFYNVPVDITRVSAELAELNLHIMEISADHVSVEVSGERGAIGRLAPEDLTATLQITSNILEPNVYDLRLVLANPGETFQVVNYTPRQIRVSVDSLEHRSFDVQPVVSSMNTAAGYILEGESVAPRQVVVTGPLASIERIDRCVVIQDVPQTLDKTFAADLPVILLDAQGAEINKEQYHLSLNTETVQLVIAVLREKELPLELRFIHQPEGFPLEELYYSMSNYEVMTAGPSDVVARYQELVLGTVDIRTISPGRNVFSFDVNMPASNVINLDNVNTVTVTFNMAGLSEDIFTVSGIELLHKPSRYDVKLLTDTVPDVRIVGGEGILETLTPEDIVATIDLSERDLPPGQYRQPVKISVPNKGLVWAADEYFAVVQVTEKE